MLRKMFAQPLPASTDPPGALDFDFGMGVRCRNSVSKERFVVGGGVVCFVLFFCNLRVKSCYFKDILKVPDMNVLKN